MFNYLSETPDLNKDLSRVICYYGIIFGFQISFIVCFTETVEFYTNVFSLELGSFLSDLASLH